MMKVRYPPDMFCTGITVASQTHRLQELRKIALRRLKIAPRIFPAIQTARKGFLISVAGSFYFSKSWHGPSKTVTPAADIEWEQDGYGVFGNRDDEVKAGHLWLDVSVGRGSSVVLEIITKLFRDIEFLLWTDLDYQIKASSSFYLFLSSADFVENHLVSGDDGHVGPDTLEQHHRLYRHETQNITNPLAKSSLSRRRIFRCFLFLGRQK